jgi:tripartite-type tricarboxylate transporter receptor subunit TctC
VPENRGGEGGTLGTAIVAKAPPDGCTMLVNNVSVAVNATLARKLPYDTKKDLAPVSIVARQPSLLAVYPSLPATSVRELLALARKRAGQLVYGSGGAGSSSHLATERLMAATHVRMLHVPYKGLAQALDDLAVDRVDLVIATMSTALPAVAAKKVRPLAVTTARRSALFPQLPTMQEAGVPGYETSTWYAVFMPARTPATLVHRVNAALRAVARDESVRSEFRTRGLTAEHTTPQQARAYVASEIERWSAVAKAARGPE